MCRRAATYLSFGARERERAPLATNKCRCRTWCQRPAGCDQSARCPAIPLRANVACKASSAIVGARHSCDRALTRGVRPLLWGISPEDQGAGGFHQGTFLTVFFHIWPGRRPTCRLAQVSRTADHATLIQPVVHTRATPSHGPTTPPPSWQRRSRPGAIAHGNANARAAAARSTRPAVAAAVLRIRAAD